MPKKLKGGSSCEPNNIDLSNFKQVGHILSESQDAFISRMNGGAYYLGVGNQKIGGLSEIVGVEDSRPATISNQPSSSYPAPLYLQNGSGFSHIVNPITNRKVKVNSTLGRKLVSEYSRVAFNKQHGGADSIFSGNMLDRTFDGQQPEWKPSDI